MRLIHATLSFWKNKKIAKEQPPRKSAPLTVAGMVDYSRFKTIIEQDELEHPDSARRAPTVTRLGKATSVTIPGRASAAASQQPLAVHSRAQEAAAPATAAPAAADADEEEDEEPAAREYFEDSLPRRAPIPTFVQAKPLPGAAASAAELTLNGLDAGAFLWSQVAEQVAIRVRVAKGTRAKQVQVLLGAAGLEVRVAGAVVLQGALAYGVWGDGGASVFATEEERFGKAMEWELQDLGQDGARCVLVRLYKRVPAAGLVVWWRRVFKLGSEPELNLDAIRQRKSDASTRGAAQGAWEEAQRLFREQRVADAAQQQSSPAPSAQQD
jgi:hypothetical protein